MSHGGDRYRNKVRLDFSVNTNPAGVLESVRQSLINSISKAEHYPDQEASALRKDLAEALQVREDMLLFGNGASEILTAAVRAAKPKNVLLPVPSFSGYQWALRPEAPKIRYVEMEDDFQITQKLIGELTEEMDMLFLTNPNNPTGRYIRHDLLEEILDICREKKILVILDECFMELSDDPEHNTCVPQISRWQNLIILRAFTKSFAIPGVRLGYMICADTALNEKIRQMLPEWNLSVMAQDAGVAALKEIGTLKEARAQIIKDRTYLKEQLEEAGLQCTPSNAGFLLLKSPREDLYEKLLEKEILIRDCSDYQGLSKGYYRVAVRPKEENEELIRAVRDVIKEK